MVVAQLVMRSLHIPKIRGSNPVIGNFIFYQLNRKDENKEKEAGDGTIKNPLLLKFHFVASCAPVQVLRHSSFKFHC